MFLVATFGDLRYFAYSFCFRPICVYYRACANQVCLFIIGMYWIPAPANLAFSLFFGNPAKSGSGLNFDRIWPDLGQLSRTVIFLTTANSTGTYVNLR